MTDWTAMGAADFGHQVDPLPLAMFPAPDPTGTADLLDALTDTPEHRPHRPRPVIDVPLPPVTPAVTDSDEVDGLEDDDEDPDTDEDAPSVAERFAARDAEAWPLERAEHAPDPVTGLTADGWIPRAPHRTGKPCDLCPATAPALEYRTRHQATAYRQVADDEHLRGVGWLEVCPAHAADAVRLMAAALEHAHAPDDLRTRVDLLHSPSCGCPDTGGRPITEHHDTDRQASARLF